MTYALPRQFDLTTSDDVRLSAAEYRRDDGGNRMVIVSHGFSGSWKNVRSRHIAESLSYFGDVIAFDFRGHGQSDGVSTVGDKEILDVAAAVDYAKTHGYSQISLVGFSMGAAVVIRYAGLHTGSVNAVVAISGPAIWYYKGTTSMRWLHWAIENRSGRLASRLVLRTRIDPTGWPKLPIPPWQAASTITPTPLLIIHGTDDRFFPLRHAHALYDAAREPRQLWVEPGMGHAESATTPLLVKRIGEWITHPT